jgi:hypothetical protein
MYMNEPEAKRVKHDQSQEGKKKVCPQKVCGSEVRKVEKSPTKARTQTRTQARKDINMEREVRKPRDGVRRDEVTEVQGGE